MSILALATEELKTDINRLGKLIKSMDDLVQRRTFIDIVRGRPLVDMYVYKLNVLLVQNLAIRVCTSGLAKF